MLFIVLGKTNQHLIQLWVLLWWNHMWNLAQNKNCLRIRDTNIFMLYAWKLNIYNKYIKYITKLFCTSNSNKKVLRYNHIICYTFWRWHCKNYNNNVYIKIIYFLVIIKKLFCFELLIQNAVRFICLKFKVINIILYHKRYVS